VPESMAAVQPVPLHGAGVKAFTVTTPDAPEVHCATPLWLIVAMLGSASNHCDAVVEDGDGGWL
jgi:hypothetical protein